MIAIIRGSERSLLVLGTLPLSLLALLALVAQAAFDIP